MNIYTAITKLYEELFIQTTLNRNYKFRPNNQDRKVVFSFIKWLYKKYHKDEIGADFLIQYFEFQFSHYIGMKTKFAKNVIMFNWIVGRKAIQRWEDRNLNLKWIVKVKIKGELELNLKNTFKKQSDKKRLDDREQFIINLNRYEENYKKRFHNTEKGIIYCEMFTTLYNPKSELCKSCNHKDECVETLKQNLEKFYNLRM